MAKPAKAKAPTAKRSRSKTSELESLRARLAEAQDTLDAIRSGEVDGIAVDGPRGPQIFTLQSADQPYRILAESMSEGAASMSADGTILFCNGRLAAMVGRTAEKLLGSPVTALVAPAELESFQRLLARGLEGEARAEVQLQHTDGSFVPVLASMRMIPAERASGLCLVATDLSDFKRAEQEKRRAQDVSGRLAAIVESSEDAIIGKSLDGVITSWNHGAERLYGYTAAEVIGQPMTLIVPPEHRADLQDLLRRVGRGDHIEHHDTERVRKDGSRVQVSVALSPTRDAAGHVTGASVIGRDVTERKRMEERLKRMNLTLRALSECTETLMRATDEAGMLQQVCNVVVGVAGYRMAWVGYAEQDANKTVLPMAAAGFEEGYLHTANISWADVEQGRGPTGTCIRSGKTTVCQDTATDPRFLPWRNQSLRRGYRSSIAIPLKIENDVLGALMIYAADARAFDSDAQGLLEELASNMTYAITALRARAESKRAEEQLREASSYARSLIEASLDPLVTISQHGKITDVNRATEEATGIPRDRLIGSDFSNYFTEPEKARSGY